MRDGCRPGKVEHPHGLRFNLDALLLSLATAALMSNEPVAASRVEVPQAPATADVDATSRVVEVPQAPDIAAPRLTSRERLRRYLTRPVARSARFLDHGVIGAAVGIGVPHIYRVELSLGVLDHLTLGATAHWLPGQARPRWTPRVAVAFFRGKLLEVGAVYTQVLYPPTKDDGDPDTVEFQRRAHYLLASVSLSQAWLTGGFDLGWGRGREALELRLPDEVKAEVGYAVRDRVAGGLHVRFGTRRVGLTAQAWFPYMTAELVLDVRFGAFELRRRGGWREL